MDFKATTFIEKAYKYLENIFDIKFKNVQHLHSFKYNIHLMNVKHVLNRIKRTLNA